MELKVKNKNPDLKRELNIGTNLHSADRKKPFDLLKLFNFRHFHKDHLEQLSYSGFSLLKQKQTELFTFIDDKDHFKKRFVCSEGQSCSVKKGFISG